MLKCRLWQNRKTSILTISMKHRTFRPIGISVSTFSWKPSKKFSLVKRVIVMKTLNRFNVQSRSLSIVHCWYCEIWHRPNGGPDAVKRYVTEICVSLPVSLISTEVPSANMDERHGRCGCQRRVSTRRMKDVVITGLASQKRHVGLIAFLIMLFSRDPYRQL